MGKTRYKSGPAAVMRFTPIVPRRSTGLSRDSVIGSSLLTDMPPRRISGAAVCPSRPVVFVFVCRSRVPS